MPTKKTPSGTTTSSRKSPRATNGKKPSAKSRTAAKPNGSAAKSRPKLGRSRIPLDAPLDIVFEHDDLAREAFDYLGIETIRELQQFGPDELIMRLTSPTKQTVGRIRKMLALNNRCLDGDERFALDVQRTQ